LRPPDYVCRVMQFSTSSPVGLPPPPKTGEGWGALRGRFFHKVLRMPTLFPQLPQLLFPGPACGFRQRQSKLADLCEQRGYHRPGFRHTAPLRPGVLAPQRPQQPHPALAKHAHEPQAGRPPRPRARRAHPRHVEQGAARSRRLRGPAHTEQPPRRHRHCQPHPCRALWPWHRTRMSAPDRAARLWLAVRALNTGGSP